MTLGGLAPRNRVLDLALAYRLAGLSILPIKPDGSKRPAVCQWKRFQKSIAPENQVQKVWFAIEGRYGIAVIGGVVSGGLEIIDFDEDATRIYPAWCELVEAEAPGLVGRLSVAITPGTGYHARYRCAEVPVPGNTKLAMRTTVEGGATLIETRGEGGYVLVEGCPPACHPTQRVYQHHSGPALAQVQTITGAEREVLIRAARSFNETTSASHATNGPCHSDDRRSQDYEIKPGDDFCARGPDWLDILGPAGWQCVHQRDHVRYWRRPGKTEPGWSATTGVCMSKDGRELLAVFSSNAAPFDGPNSGKSCSTYNKFSAYALLNHRGDFRVAAKALIELGYGNQNHTKLKSDVRNERPSIVISTEEHEVNAAAIDALVRDEAVFQRGNMLVRVVRDVSPATKGIRRPFAPRIDVLPPSLLRERLAANARWIVIQETKNGAVEKPGHPPPWCVAAVHVRADWGGIRHLEAVVDYPVLRPDGSILNRPGYDPETGLLLESTTAFPEIPDRPSMAEAVAAAHALLEVVADFPFERDVHRAAWLAALLTPLARFGFSGPAPLFLADANVRAAGKGLLLDSISRIVTGERFTIATYTSDDDELRKRITSLVLAGDRVVLFDNLEGKFGSAVLDAALTGTAWKDRVLGVNRMAEAPLYMTWFATGNNVAIAADTARRTCHIRLESPEERPEERQGFRHPDLLAWVGANRAKLLTSALTILRAYCAAGRPDLGIPAWGSFEGWSALVRSAVVWLGLPDPGETRLLLQQQADVAAESMGTILTCWEFLDPDRRGLTAAEVIHRLYKEPLANLPAFHCDLREALEALLGKPSARALGNRLRSYRRRVFEGRFIDQAGSAQRAARWAVFPAAEFRCRWEKTHETHASRSEFGESGESGESLSDEASEEGKVLFDDQKGPYREGF